MFGLLDGHGDEVGARARPLARVQRVRARVARARRQLRNNTKASRYKYLKLMYHIALSIPFILNRRLKATIRIINSFLMIEKN